MKKFVVFRLGTEEFGVDIKSVVEILRIQKANPIPNLPEFLSGVITVRGQVIPLMDMRMRFGIHPDPSNERIIIVKFRGDKIAFSVDEVKEIMAFKKEEMTVPPSIFKGLKTEYMRGIGKKDNRVVVLLNIDQLLSSDERIVLEESKEFFE